jgi:hypothetical protein
MVSRFGSLCESNAVAHSNTSLQLTTRTVPYRLDLNIQIPPQGNDSKCRMVGRMHRFRAKVNRQLEVDASLKAKMGLLSFKYILAHFELLFAHRNKSWTRAWALPAVLMYTQLCIYSTATTNSCRQRLVLTKPLFHEKKQRTQTFVIHTKM